MFNRFSTDVKNVQKLEDRPQMLAQDLKAIFDKASEDLQIAVNGLMEQLESTTASNNIGIQGIEGYASTKVQGLLEEIVNNLELLKSSNNIYAESGNGYERELLTVRLNNLKKAIDNLVIGQFPDNSISNDMLNSDIKIGNIQNLNTVEKSNIVASMNEININKVSRVELAPTSFNIDIESWIESTEKIGHYETSIIDNSILSSDTIDFYFDSDCYDVAEIAGIVNGKTENGKVTLYSRAIPTNAIYGRYYKKGRE